MCCQQITVKNWQNLLICNPKADLHNINANTKFRENPLIFTSYCPEMKILMCRRQIILSKVDKICQSAIQNQISTISMHIPSLKKIHSYLINLSSRNETRGPWWSYIAHLSKQVCILNVEVSAKFTALRFMYKFYNHDELWRLDKLGRE